MAGHYDLRRSPRGRRHGIQACLILVGAALTVAAFGQTITEFRIGEIEFYGYAGLDLSKIKTALPLHEGDVFSEKQMTDALRRAREAVKRVTGHEPTDLAPVCCDPRGRWILYVGLPGSSSRRFAYNPAPQGHNQLPASVVKLYQRVEDANLAAVQKGHAQENDSQGYALASDPALRALQMTMHDYALHHEGQVRRVLAGASDAKQRQVAAMVLGYARRSPGQIASLVRASRDVDDGVRNNATRALLVLAKADRDAARAIPAQAFIEMLSSGVWTDRNKASFLLLALSAGRNASLLGRLRGQALQPLIEMARWDADHAYAARVMLGRIAGIPEGRLTRMVNAGQVDALVDAARKTAH